MGPGSFDPGSAAASRQDRKAAPGFNGAGVFRPRKCFCPSGQHRTTTSLQWGRGLSTPEVVEARTCPLHRTVASMGPGSFDPGSRSRRLVIVSRCVLQWGRGLSTPEVAVPDQPWKPIPWASMGPGSFDPGSRRAHQHRIGANPASMGPGSFDPGSVRRFRALRPGGLASMGPGSFDPGSLSAWRRPSYPDTASMGPGSFDPGSQSGSSIRVISWSASMGPGSFDPGSRRSRFSKARTDGLQWGRGLSTPEVGI